MSFHSALAKFAQAAAAARGDAFGARDASGRRVPCKIGPSMATARPVMAYTSDHRKEQAAGEGGFAGLNPHTAVYLKAGHAVPVQGHFFYDGTAWFTVSAVTSHPVNPEWVIDLEPLDSTGNP